jgi:hypothetical protein
LLRAIVSTCKTDAGFYAHRSAGRARDRCHITCGDRVAHGVVGLRHEAAGAARRAGSGGLRRPMAQLSLSFAAAFRQSVRPIDGARLARGYRTLRRRFWRSRRRGALGAAENQAAGSIGLRRDHRPRRSGCFGGGPNDVRGPYKQCPGAGFYADRDLATMALTDADTTAVPRQNGKTL